MAAAVPARPYAGVGPRLHSETVLRGFYDFHLDAGTGPIMNPFPLDRARRGGRAHAHHNPMEPYRDERAGLYRPRLPAGFRAASPTRSSTRSSPGCRSHRDRALVAFYVSTGARASELLSVTQGGVDPGRQLISVVRKGSGELQELRLRPTRSCGCGSTRREMEGLVPRGRRQPLWWTLRAPVRPLTYHAVHRMFERVNDAGGHLRRPCTRFATPRPTGWPRTRRSR